MMTCGWAMRLGCLGLFGVSLLSSHGAQAQSDSDAPHGVALRVDRVESSASLSRSQQHYRMRVTVALDQWQSADVVGDSRLLWFEIQPLDSKRVTRCKHPRAPRKQPPSKRVVHLGKRVPEKAAWSEELDVRMFCSGRALRTLAKGALLKPYYGWPKPNRSRWLARATDRPADRVRRLQGPPLVIGPEPKIPGKGPAVLRMTPISRPAGRSLQFSLRLTAKEDARMVYVRPDQYTFRVHGPSQTVQCGMEMLKVSPIRDFFRKISKRRALSHRLEAGAYCPGFFRTPGIYEVTPILELVHNGAKVGVEALTGIVEGEPAMVRLY